MPALTGHAFGVELTGADALLGLVPGPVPGARHRTAAILDDERSVARRWPTGDAQRLIEHRWPDGALFLAVDEHPEHGFRFEAPGCGTHVVSPDGRMWFGAPARAPAWRWHDLIFSQVLPTIAALHGLEPLHASAVAIGGRAYGMVASSGVGKSSTAAHLLAMGAAFVTDDVLALEEIAGCLVAHPGPRVVKLHDLELASMTPAARRRLGEPWGESDGKRHLRPFGTAGPLPLGGLVFLTRAPDARAVGIEVASDSVHRLLAGAFAPHVATRRRLERQLAACAAAHRDAVLWRALVPDHCTASDVARALWLRLGAGPPAC